MQIHRDGACFDMNRRYLVYSFWSKHKRERTVEEITAPIIEAFTERFHKNPEHIFIGPISIQNQVIVKDYEVYIPI